MSTKLTEDELTKLKAAFDHLINYESDDPTDPIDPLSYRAPDGDSCLHIAVTIENIEIVRLLLKGGVDINLIGDMGCTALHIATMRKNKEIAKLLIDSGASLEIRNKFGRLPLDE